MFWSKREQIEAKELDRIGRSVLWSASASDEETDRVGPSPYLYARIAARIEEQKRGGESADSWFAIFAEARRATVALALVAAAAFGVFWLLPDKSPGQPPAIIITSDISGREAPVSACSLSSAEECAISNDDVLATMFAGEGGEQR
jgi:hypothetical protein